MYEFQGVFTRQSCMSLRLDCRKYTLRDLRPSYPFCGIRIHPRFDEAGDDVIRLEDAALEIIEGGLASGLALSYFCWGGELEHFAGFEIDNFMIIAASRFDSGFESSEDELLAFFVSKMSEYGLPPEDSGFFFPFVSGFWAELGRE